MGRAGRAADELRAVVIQRGYTEMTPGSVLMEMGKTRVLCTVSFESDVPPWLRGASTGWVTAEYSMLPGSGRERISRGSSAGGRVKEIQRLIGRSLRSVVDPAAMGEATMRVDCDVLQADGGTRTAAITGGWVALHDAFEWAAAEGHVPKNPLLDHCAAVSVGIVDGAVVLDMDYEEDVNAEVDANVVMTGSGLLVELQGTAEGDPFTRDQLGEMLDLAQEGIDSLISFQRQAVIS